MTKLEEKAKKLGKSLLIEDFSFAPNKSSIEVFNTTKLTESKDGEFKAFAVIREVQVTRFTENFNKRIYPKKLWERLAKGQFAEGTLSLADHPTDDGSTTKIIGVWHNFKVQEDTCVADLYLVGKNGRLMLEVIEAGGKAGMSSVGFGELEEDDKTVKWDTYDLERLADWVLTPSQNVFATIENRTIKNQPLKETITNNSISGEIESTNKVSKLNTNTKQESMTMNKTLLESTYKNQINSLIRESKVNLNLLEAQAQLQEALNNVPDDQVLITTKLEQALEGVNSKLEQKVYTQEQALKENSSLLEDLNAKYEASVAIIEAMKERQKKLDEVVAKLSEADKEEKDDKNMPSKKVKMKKESVGFDNLTEREFMIFKENFATLEENIRLQEEDLKFLLHERKEIIKENEWMAEDINLRDLDIALLREDRETAINDVKMLKEDRENAINDVKYLKEIRIAKTEKLVNPKSTISEDYQPPRAKDANTTLAKTTYTLPSARVETIKTVLAEGEYTLPSKRAKLESLASTPRARRIITESTDSIRTSLLPYYEKVIKKNPSLVDIREDILDASSFLEAVEIVESYGSTINDSPIKISESNVVKSVDDDWLEGYK